MNEYFILFRSFYGVSIRSLYGFSFNLQTVWMTHGLFNVWSPSSFLKYIRLAMMYDLFYTWRERSAKTLPKIFAPTVMHEIGPWISYARLVSVWYQEYPGLVEWVRKCASFLTLCSSLKMDKNLLIKKKIGRACLYLPSQDVLSLSEGLIARR